MSWIQTYTGKAFDVLDPRPELVDIEDIAHALACINRFTGHLKVPMSVAQHSFNASMMCPEAPLEALLHDAAEAYVNDVSRPVKMVIEGVFRPIEDRVDAAIRQRFGLGPMKHPRVKFVDNVLLKLEAERGFGPLLPGWERWPDPPSGMSRPYLVETTWRQAEKLFLEHFDQVKEIR